MAERCLARRGRYLLTVGGLHEYLRAAWTRVLFDRTQIVGMSIDKRRALRTVSQLVAHGALRPVIDRRYPLAALPEAHRYVDTGRKRGNVVIDVRAR